MAKKSTPTSKKNLCPVCGNHHGCKIQDDKWILCLRGSSQQDASPGYRFVKPLQNGMGGLFVLGGTANQNQEQWQRNQETKRFQRESERAEYQAKLLPVEERSSQYRLVNQQLRLINRHRKALHEERKLTDSEIDLAIELGAIRTWNPGQQIIGALPDLAGIDPLTGSLAGIYGIAIYSFDPAGNITGAQLKPDNKEFGKYIWLSSSGKGGSGPHLPNSELPLFVWKNPQNPTISEVWLCEGALKSLLAALRLWRSGRTDIVVIGTATSAHYGEKTLKKYLEQLNCKTLRLMPDAGAVANPAICQANQQTLECCQRWGYSITVGWWGQLDKSHPDIDELGDFSTITYLSPKDFLGGYFQKLHPDTIELVKQRAQADIVELISEHVSLKQQGKDFVGFCPFHIDQRSSLFKSPSFYVSPTKQFYNCLDCGNGGNAIKFLVELGRHSGTAVVLDLARRYQIQARSIDNTPIILPTDPLPFHKTSSELCDSDRTISGNEWHEKFGLPEWLKTQVGNFKRLLTRSVKRSKSTAQSDARSEAELQPKPETLVYVPGKLPEYQAYIKMGSPVIRFEQTHRFDLIHELREKNYPFVLDRSGTGSSKSHSAGKLNRGTLEVEQLWYVSVDHRNPTVPTVEANFTDMPVRNPGMVADPSKRTALNRHHLRWPRPGEFANVEGNCFQTEKFHALAEKGYDAVTDSAKDNPICGSCAKSLNCAGAIVEGKYYPPEPNASFRDERRQVFEHRLIRSSPLSLPGDDYFSGTQEKEDGDGEDKEPRSYAIIWDEIGRLLNPTKKVSIGFAEFDQFWAMVEAKNEELHTLLRPLRTRVRSLLSGEVDCTADTRHGFNTTFIRDWLADIPDYSWDELDRHLKHISPDLQEVVKDRKAVEALHPNWLPRFLEVLLKKERGAFTVRHGELHIATYDSRLADIVAATAFNLFLDTTMKREYLGLYLDIDPNMIAVIEQELENFSNLSIVQVAGWGLAGHQRSDSFKNRKEAFKAALERKYPGKKVVVLDFKEHSGGDNGNWFNHNRATNEFENADVLAVWGTPYENIGSSQESYLCISPLQDISKTSKEFGDFVRWKVEAEIAQTPGRLRANRRPDKQLSVYFCFDYDMGFLSAFYPGARITQEEAFNICAVSGTISQQSLHRIQQRILEFARATGEKLESITQVAAAQAAGVTQGRISQIAAKLGGWQAFRQLLAFLLDSPNRGTNVSEHLDDEQMFMANTYLPLAAEESPPDAIGAIVDCFQVYGWRVFETILAATPIKTRGQMLAVLIAGLPESLREEFRAIASGASG